MVNANNNTSSNDNNINPDSLPPSEMKAYYRGLKRGISLTFVTMNLREATMLNYARYPQLRFIKGDPLMIAQDIINSAYRGMNQPVPTPQEISLYDITTQEVGINILGSLMGMGLQNKTDNNTIPPGVKKSQQQQPEKKKQKIPYDKERARKSGALDFSKELREEFK